jgi:hypothetical protein
MRASHANRVFCLARTDGRPSCAPLLISHIARQADDVEAGFIHLVDFVIKHMGEVPKDPDQLAQLLLGVCLHYVPKCVQSAFTIIERENVEKYFSVHIAEALNTLRQSESCGWEN